MLFFGGGVIQNFAFAIAGGGISARITTLYIASPIVILWEEKLGNKKKKKILKFPLLETVTRTSITMTSVEEARSIVLSHTRTMGLEKVDLFASLGRVIGEDIKAPFNIPPQDNSAMDGYAVRSGDIKEASPGKPVSLKVIGEIPAGFLPQKMAGPAEAIRIMTGAPVPRGADTVVKKEDTSFAGGIVNILTAPDKGKNIRRAVENVTRVIRS